MKKGGYQILDLKDVNLTTSGVVIKGIYDDIKENKRKVILLSGITINGVQFSDAFVKVVKVGTEFLLNVYSTAVDNELSMYDIFIEDDDTVTLQINSVEGENGEGMENPMTTAFDMIVGGTDGEPERLEAGNVGEVLTMGQSGVEWAEPTEGMTNPMVSPKDIIVGGTSGTPTRLATGSTGQVLTVADSGLEWATPSASAGVSSLGGATGAITLGSGLSITGNELSASGGGGSGFNGFTLTITDNSRGTANIYKADGTSILDAANGTYNNVLAVDFVAGSSFINSGVVYTDNDIKTPAGTAVDVGSPFILLSDVSFTMTNIG